MQNLHAYLRLMRLHQPVGIWLVYWPCAWAVLLAAKQNPDFPTLLVILYLALFFLAAIVMRSAGCIINDLADRELDKHVERTKMRPLASGELQPIDAFKALALLFSVASGLLIILIEYLPGHIAPQHLLITTLPVIALIIAYPFMKRITWWPQAFFGITFNWGVLISWMAVAGTFTLSTTMLYAACFFWTLGYDTIYGHQDKKDDEKIGIKSTSRHLETHGKLWIGGFYSAMALCIGLSCLLIPLSPIFIIGAVAIIFAHSCVQLLRWNPDNPLNCMKIFKSNVTLGELLFLWFIAILYL